MTKLGKKLKSETQLYFESAADWTARMPAITATLIANKTYTTV